jgi:hypothetical protein
MPRLLLAALASGCAFVGATAAPAAVLDVFGDTTGSPTYHRPVQISGGVPTSLDSRDFHYQAFTFQVSQTGQYRGRVTSLNPSGWDNVLGLYNASFDPLEPLLNAITYVDDTIGLDAQFDTMLIEGQTYVAVVTGFREYSAGTFRLQFDGIGSVVPNPGVPEPATWAMMIGGLGLVGGVARRRSGHRVTA